MKFWKRFRSQWFILATSIVSPETIFLSNQKIIFKMIISLIKWSFSFQNFLNHSQQRKQFLCQFKEIKIIFIFGDTSLFFKVSSLILDGTAKENIKTKCIFRKNFKTNDPRSILSFQHLKTLHEHVFIW